MTSTALKHKFWVQAAGDLLIKSAADVISNNNNPS
jgi:hypothetical protein